MLYRRKNARKKKASVPDVPRKASPWYQDLISSRTLSGERSVFAIRGSLPSFPNLLLTLRIIHLYEMPGQSNKPYHFPIDSTQTTIQGTTSPVQEVETTHHLFLHTRVSHQAFGVSKLSPPDLTLSTQFSVEGDEDYLTRPPFLPITLNQEGWLLSRKQKSANLITAQVGYLLANDFMPRLEKEAYIRRFIDPVSRLEGRIQLSDEEFVFESERLFEWSFWIDAYYRQLMKRYYGFLE